MPWRPIAFTRKNEDKMWKFQVLDGDLAYFEHHPLFPAPGTVGPEKLQVKHEELKNFRKVDKEPPKLLAPEELSKLMPQQNKALAMETARATAQLALVNHFNEHFSCMCW